MVQSHVVRLAGSVLAGNFPYYLSLYAHVKLRWPNLAGQGVARLSEWGQINEDASLDPGSNLDISDSLGDISRPFMVQPRLSAPAPLR
jgi:hypothetical protein